jgi:hypothetical protein
MNEFDPPIPERNESKTIEEKIEYEARERESNAETFEGDNIFTKHMDSIDPAIRPRIIELFREEAGTLRALDPSTTTSDTIHRIYLDYEAQRSALFPPGTLDL